MLEQAAEKGAINALKAVGYQSSDEISQSEAGKRYGRAIVDRWVRMGLIRGERRGTAANSKIYFSVSKLDALKASERNIKVTLRTK